MNNFDDFYVGDEDSILISRFDPQKNTKILAHGFTSNGMDDFVTGTTEAYLGTIHKGRPQNFWDFGPLPPLSAFFCFSFDPPTLADVLYQPDPPPSG